MGSASKGPPSIRGRDSIRVAPGSPAPALPPSPASSGLLAGLGRAIAPSPTEPSCQLHFATKVILKMAGVGEKVFMTRAKSSWRTRAWRFPTGEAIPGPRERRYQAYLPKEEQAALGPRCETRRLRGPRGRASLAAPPSGPPRSVSAEASADRRGLCNYVAAQRPHNCNWDKLFSVVWMMTLRVCAVL